MSDLLKPADQHPPNTRTTLLKLNHPLRKTNHRQKSLSYVAPIIWNKLPDFFKITENVNTYKHKGVSGIGVFL